MSTLSKFQPHTLHVCGWNLITGLTSAASPRVGISSTCQVGQKLGVSLPLLTWSPSEWPSRFLYGRGRKSRRHLWVILCIDTRCSCEVPFILIRILEILNLLNLFSKNLEISSNLKNSSSASRVLYADGRTDRHDESDNRFSQFRKGA